MRKKFYFFIGTTAELIKLAPIIAEFQSRKIKFKIIISGQTKVHLEEFSDWLAFLEPDIVLKSKKDTPSVFYFLLWAIQTFFSSLFMLWKELRGKKRKEIYFIVHGDTVSALIGALAAKTYRVNLVHIESGLYSFNLLEPFPEEICRQIIDRIADINSPPNHWAENNIKGFRGERVVTGENTLIESFLWSKKVKPITETTGNISKLGKYYILILHRQEHVIFNKKWSRDILEFVIREAKKGLNCVLVRHPLTVEIIGSLNLESLDGKGGEIIIMPRLPYPDFMKLMENSEFIATDGCINQLEAYYMGIPLLALRNLTEQMEGLGKNVVLCKSDGRVMRDFLLNYKKHKTEPVKSKIRPSKMIVDYLVNR